MRDIDLIRAARQLVETDDLLGAEAVPLGRPLDLGGVPEATPDASTPATPAAQHSRRDPPARTHRKPAQPAAPRSEQPVTLTDTSLNEPLPKHDMSKKQQAAALEQLEGEVADWVRANWPQDGWMNVVFGEGDPNANLLFIGEGPGADEDRQGRPFVGRAGQLLDKQITAMGLKRADVYIANIAKTRPPGNRVPTPEEASRWLPWLEKQIEIIQPKVIVTLGATSAKYLLQDMRLRITRERGNWKKHRGVDLMPTFHPAYLLRQYTKENRQRVWGDLKAVMDKLGMST